MLPFGVHPLGVLLAAVATFVIGMLWYSPLLFGKAWARLNGYDTPEKVAALQRGAARAYGISFVAYLVLGIGVGALVQGEPLGQAVLIAFQIWVFLIMPVSLTALMFSERTFGAWLIDAMYQVVYFGAMGAVLSRWG